MRHHIVSIFHMLLSISLVAACSQDSDSSTQALTSPDAQAGQAGSAGEEDTGQAGGGAAGQPGSVGGQGGISSTG
ncbi:MAG: ferritin-like domain-containing protein, partial [Polyangiaceae bacterium]|nr:ferritin-like domain-containing protein [Polyangiaceae bacterium]